MKTLLLTVLLFAVGTTSFAKSKPQIVNQYANVTQMTLDPNLPEPFARTQEAQIVLKYTEQAATLLFAMDETEGIEVTFPITSDVTDKCQVRTVTATPPENSTPYYKDFEIKVIDYSANTCSSTKVEAPTIATLRSYEVGVNAKTLSTFKADRLTVYKEQN